MADRLREKIAHTGIYAVFAITSHGVGRQGDDGLEPIGQQTSDLRVASHPSMPGIWQSIRVASHG